MRGTELHKSVPTTHQVSVTALRNDASKVLQLLEKEPDAIVGITWRGKVSAVVISPDRWLGDELRPRSRS